MKSASFILSFAFIIGAFNVRANFEPNLNSEVVRNFKIEFNGAQNINWSTAGKLDKATFTLNGQEWYAFYAANGKRVALARNLHVQSLPINLVKEIRAGYEEHWITSVFEVSIDDESNYYVTVENADQTITLKSVGTTEWVKVNKKTKK